MQSGGPNILIIDDDAGDAELLRRELSDIEGWVGTIFHSLDAENAAAIASPKSVDVILLDYNLGSISGVDSIPLLHIVGFDAPIIMLTGQSDSRIAVRALQAGASDYLSKGAANCASLKRSIDNALEKHELGKELEQQRQALEESNRDLREKNREIQNFYHVLAHELRTPLTSAREFVSILLDEVSGEINADQRQYLSIIRDGCNQIGVCLDDLLDTTRLDTGKLTIRKEEVSAPEILLQVARSLQPTAEQSGIVLESIIELDAPQIVMADSSRVIQILNNLVGNALKFTPRGGRIEIVLKQTLDSEPMAQFSVIDSGRGISQEQCGRVFDRLYQVFEKDAATEKGLGLGLTLCKELTELHGGRIWVESTLGQGSAFSFTIPMALAPVPLGFES